MVLLAHVTGLGVKSRWCYQRSEGSWCVWNNCPAGILPFRHHASKVGPTARRYLSKECGSSSRLSVRAAAGPRYGPQKQALLATRQGMELFRQGDVSGSVVQFDRALELDPSQKPYLWQRGLSLYYLDQFEEGAAQFREDVAVNPNDTEEAIWCYLCEAKVYGTTEARKRYLKIGADSRSYMRKAYELFRDGGSPDSLLKEAGPSDASNTWFYAKLYTGLYYESEGDTEAAKAAIEEAAGSEYAGRSDDYMAAVAVVHCSIRGWEPVIVRSSNYAMIAVAIFCVILPAAMLLSNQ